jgi:hypothetical protein
VARVWVRRGGGEHVTIGRYLRLRRRRWRGRRVAPTAPVSPRAVNAATTHDVSHGIFRHAPRENPKSFSTLFSLVGNEAHEHRQVKRDACNVFGFVFESKGKCVGFDTARKLLSGRRSAESEEVGLSSLRNRNLWIVGTMGLRKAPPKHHRWIWNAIDGFGLEYAKVNCNCFFFFLFFSSSLLFLINYFNVKIYWISLFYENALKFCLMVHGTVDVHTFPNPNHHY